MVGLEDFQLWVPTVILSSELSRRLKGGGCRSQFKGYSIPQGRSQSSGPRQSEFLDQREPQHGPSASKGWDPYLMEIGSLKM